MTRARFLNDLYRLLAGNGMDADQAEQHLTYYAEMLADRMEEGMTEDKAVAGMEPVDTIARRILEEEGLSYRPLSEIPVSPPAYPDASRLGGGGGKRGYQVPKKLSRQRLLQAGLWALAIVIALGAASRWMLARNARRYANATRVDSVSSSPVSEIPAEEAPYAWEYDEGYAMDLAYMEGYEYSGGYMSIDGVTVDSIDIEWASGTVYLQSCGGTNIQIQEFAHSELDGRTSCYMESEDGELTIRYREGTSLGNVKGGKWLTVLVPDGLLEELDIETTSAEVRLNGLELGEIDVTTASGVVQMNECYLQTADVETISGEVYLNNVYADELDVSTTSGEVSGVVYCTATDVGTTSGDVRLYAEGVAEHVGLSTVSGEMRVDAGESIRSIQAKSTSGDITLSLPWDLGFAMDFSTVSGELISSFDTVMQDGKLLCNGGGCEIEVETVSGNLDIY